MKTTIGEWLRNVSEWALANNLELNVGNSREMLIAVRKQNIENPPLLADVERVTSLKIFGGTTYE